MGTYRRRASSLWADTPDTRASSELYNGDINEVRKEAIAHYPKKWAAESANLLLKTTDMANNFAGVFGKYASISFAGFAVVGAAGFLITQSTDPSTAIATVGMMAVGSGGLKFTEILSEKLDPYIRSKSNSVRRELNTLESNKAEREIAMAELSSSENGQGLDSMREEMRRAFGECVRTAEDIVGDRAKMEAALSSFSDRNNCDNVNRLKNRYISPEIDRNNDGVELDR